MCSLGNGPHPEIDKITLAEKNAELHHEKINQKNNRKGNRVRLNGNEGIF